MQELDHKGMALDMATKLADANKTIDSLVSAINHLAMAVHVGHGVKFCEPGADWQRCRHPTCRVAQLAYFKVRCS